MLVLLLISCLTLCLLLATVVTGVAAIVFGLTNSVARQAPPRALHTVVPLSVLAGLGSVSVPLFTRVHETLTVPLAWLLGGAATGAIVGWLLLAAMRHRYLTGDVTQTNPSTSDSTDSPS